MNQPDVNKIAEHYSAILTEIGADLGAEGTGVFQKEPNYRTELFQRLRAKS